MTKPKKLEASPSQRGKTARIMAYSNDDDPLPGRTPSAAFMAALNAVGKMGRKKKR